MQHQELLVLRASCAGGSDASHRIANSALKSIRFMSTKDEPDGGCEGSSVDITEMAGQPILPWQYTDDKGPTGQWAGQAVFWSWREYLANLDPANYELMFDKEDITSFVCRACPFPSPYPATSNMPHWEFTATRADGIKVGIHPPGRGGKLMWTTTSDEELSLIHI